MTREQYKASRLYGIAGHNCTIGAAVELQSSSDNFAADVTSVLCRSRSTTKLVKIYLKRGKRYYENRISGHFGSPYMALASRAEDQESDWATAPLPTRKRSGRSPSLAGGGMLRACIPNIRNALSQHRGRGRRSTPGSGLVGQERP